MATLSRYAMVQLACFSPYARATGGVGEPFVRGIRLEHHVVRAALSTGECPALWRSARRVHRCARRPGNAWDAGLFLPTPRWHHTGDVLGATNELNEALVLLLATVVY